MKTVTKGNIGRNIFSIESLQARALLLLLGVFLLFYFSALSGFTFAIDDEMGAIRDDPAIWASQGRWLMYLLELRIIPQPILTFFPLFVFGLCCSAGYLLVAKAHNIDLDDGRIYLLFVIFCAFPTVFHIINFAANLIGLGIGILTCCGAIYLFCRDVSSVRLQQRKSFRRLGSFAAQAALVAIAIGAYQSIVLLALAGYLGIMLHQMVDSPAMPWREWLVRHGWIAAVLAMATLTSEAIGYSLRNMLGTSLEYVNGFFRPELLLENPGGVLLGTLTAMWEIYGGTASAYGYVYYSIPALILVGLIGLAERASAQGLARAGFAVLYGAGVLIAPFLLNLASGGSLPLRSMIGVPFAIWSVVLLAVFSRRKPVWVAALALSTVVAIQSLYSFSSLQSAKQLQFDWDKQLAAEIYFRATDKIPDFDRTRQYEIAVFGSPRISALYPIPRTSTYGASIFDWSQGRTARVAALLKVLGYSGFSAAYEGDPRRALEMLAMPTWPHPDSVRFSQGVVLVRLGDRPNTSYQASIDRAASEVPALEFWRMGDSVAEPQVRNAVMQGKDATGIAVSAGRDVQIAFVTGVVEKLRSCRVLRVSGVVQAEQPDVAQLYYLPHGAGGFSESNSVRAVVGPENSTGRVNFVITSSQGFEDKLRLDPVRGAQASKMSDLALSCLVQK